MDEVLNALMRGERGDVRQHKPLFFRLSRPDDRSALATLLADRPQLEIHDTLHSQLAELLRALNPSVRFSAEGLREAAIAHLGDTIPAEYGVWVLYPWNNRLVHLLDEEEFVLVRTDRNRNKITREEQAALATKRVGVIGLSVGQSACLTMALERSFGELRIADHDHLDLSNLNRLRSGVHHLGLPKTVNVAREIAEIDPFLKVTCFHQGVTRDNVDAFLTEGGKLDVLIEECDSVDIKILARQRAKAHGIPVVMDTSDRGMIDVERFDLEPDRTIMHGLVEHLDLDLAAKARTNEEKLPFVIPILGLDTLSTRMKASMLEIENSVTTWPQLATSVVMGGAAVADICRRILLNEARPSGRWFLEAEESTEKQGSPSTASSPPAPLTLEEMIDSASMVTGLPADRMELDRSEAMKIAEAGNLAPSGGNSQPWNFLLYEGRLFLFIDPPRAQSAIDPGLRFAHLGLGAAAENMVLKAGEIGIQLDVRTADLPQGSGSVTVFTASKRGANMADPLAALIASRCTNRKKAGIEPIAQNILDALRGDLRAHHPMTEVVFLSDREAITRIARCCGEAERVRALNPHCHHDMFVREMRWTPEEAERTCDGVDLRTLELGLSDRTGLQVAADASAMRLVAQWQGGEGIVKLTARTVEASGAIAVLCVPDLSERTAFEAGRAVQRLWLKATSFHLALQPISAPIFMGVHGLWDHGGILSQEEHATAAEILGRLKTILPSGTMPPLFMLRMSHGEPPSFRSLRRPLITVFHEPIQATHETTK